MQEAYRKDLSHLTWDEVYARQTQRALLVPDWMDALQLKVGDRVLDVGAGPGFVSFLLAERVGPTGLIYAVDPSAEALSYLERLQTKKNATNIVGIVADAAKLSLPGTPLDAALIAMVLHHTDDPSGIVRNVAHLLKPGGRAVIAEFHPDGPCEHGPPRDHRLMPSQVQIWCDAAGLPKLDERRQSAEHYMMVVQRPALSSASGASATLAAIPNTSLIRCEAGATGADRDFAL
jgi:ubiquinone/menaquinone biosynthesis C-methylase UbiE